MTAQPKLYNRAQVARIVGVQSTNLHKKYPDFFKMGRAGAYGKLWTEDQVRALCEHAGVDFDTARERA